MFDSVVMEFFLQDFDTTACIEIAPLCKFSQFFLAFSAFLLIFFIFLAVFCILIFFDTFCHFGHLALMNWKLSCSGSFWLRVNLFQLKKIFFIFFSIHWVLNSVHWLRMRRAEPALNIKQGFWRTQKNVQDRS